MPLAVSKEAQSVARASIMSVSVRQTASFLTVQGERVYHELGLGSRSVSIAGKLLTLDAALKKGAALSGAKKEAFARDVSFALSELFRINDANTVTNPLGMAYDTHVSAPATALKTKSFNCFGGSLLLAATLAYAAQEMGIRTTVEIVPVPIRIVRDKMDETGHAIVRQSIAGSEYFFDVTNTFLRAGELTRLPGKEGGIGFGSVEYAIDRPIPVTEKLFADATIQERLMNGGFSQQEALAQLSRMHPSLVRYFFDGLPADAREEFLGTYYTADRLRKEAQPVVRFVIALHLLRRDAEFARIAMSSLAQVREEGTMHLLPMKGVLKPLIALHSKTDKKASERLGLIPLIFRSASQLGQTDSSQQRAFAEFVRQNIPAVQNYFAHVGPAVAFESLAIYALCSPAPSKDRLINTALRSYSINPQEFHKYIAAVVQDAPPLHKVLMERAGVSVLYATALKFISDAYQGANLAQFGATTNSANGYLARYLARHMREFAPKNSVLLAAAR